MNSKVKIILFIILGIVCLAAAILFIQEDIVISIVQTVLSALWFLSAYLNYLKIKNSNQE